MSFSQILFDAVLESTGYPAKVRRLLAERSDVCINLTLPAGNIDSASVVKWNELGVAVSEWPRSEPGQLMGYRKNGIYYDSFTLQQAEVSQICQKRVIESWSCDIRQVHGFSASKSDLTKFFSMEEFAERRCSDLIAEVSYQALARNLAHDQIRITRPNTGDFFKYHQWDGRLFLINSGGSHHFAAAKVLAARLNEPVALTGSLHFYSLNTTAIRSLRKNFDLFAISAEPEVANAFHEAMKSFEATWLWTNMPRPYDQAQVIFLPKDEYRSRQIAKALRDAGAGDLGEHLEELSLIGESIYHIG